MLFQNAFKHIKTDKEVCVGIIGIGHFASAIVGQSTAISRLNVQVGVDTNLDAACDAFRHAGFSEENIVVCETVKSAVSAMERGARVVLADALMLMELPVDVVVEATGDAEAGALHGLQAIRHGKHLAMVNKETDAVVGPILKRKADKEGVVYTAVDGDQHGLLIQLVYWAREIGLEVLCGGKFCDTGIRFDPGDALLTARGKTVSLDRDTERYFRGIAGESVSELVARRAAFLGEWNPIDVNDYEESAIMANATGLVPDTEELHHPTLRPAEIPEVLCPVQEGGILQNRGAIDAVIELRDPGVMGLGGGVFVVVTCVNDYSFQILRSKGELPANSRGTALMIHRPYHFCGVEATLSILYAGLLGVATGASEYYPRFDVVGRASRQMAAGETIQCEDLAGALQPSRPVHGESPIPVRMAEGRPLAMPVSEGDLITVASVVPPRDSSLWALRAEQDDWFLKATTSESTAPADC